ncbi:hypothetical protein [Flavobacterium sp. HSC-61S13]|uniref:hypothetical protein n=1 Tax=Flavobacterium sp. HSC-61S13 TaxID=2910963 RepID=UPI00209E473B|nr:hypothetical protein [Flavobacterium sp. HSC-61S13]MCP1997087.1 hypothetical protein [Flavobacterium sp. HSC-61S13]
MDYKFSLDPYGQKDMTFKFYGIEIDSLTDETWALNGINWWGWTVEEIQKIIDKSMSLVDNQNYEYQVEGSDLILYIKRERVCFYDMRSEQEEADLIWSFEQFIDFMEQFKAFVAENG